MNARILLALALLLAGAGVASGQQKPKKPGMAGMAMDSAPAASPATATSPSTSAWR